MPKCVTELMGIPRGGLRVAGGRWGEDRAEECWRLPVPLAHGRKGRGAGGGGLVFCSPLAVCLILRNRIWFESAFPVSVLPFFNVKTKVAKVKMKGSVSL